MLSQWLGPPTLLEESCSSQAYGGHRRGGHAVPVRAGRRVLGQTPVDRRDPSRYDILTMLAREAERLYDYGLQAGADLAVCAWAMTVAAGAGELDPERAGLEKDLTDWHRVIPDVSGRLRPGEDDGAIIGRLAELQERIHKAETPVRKLREQMHAIHHQLLEEDEAALALSIFDPFCGSRTPHEQVRAVYLLVERVHYDGSKGKVSITFRPPGIKPLARELSGRAREHTA
jgi:hypothetical protein